MSVTTEPPRDPGEGFAPESTPEAELHEDVCAQCGAQLAEDQEWCLECGAARTVVHRAPDWRIPIAIIGVVVALVLAAFAIALISLSNDANRSAQTLPSQLPTSSQPSATTRSATQASNAAVGGWPSGVNGWTVELAARRRRTRAFNVARLFLGSGIKAGVLNSSNHPLMTPGFWVVFSGRYPDQASAASAATALRSEGHRRARAVEVAAPGGI
jgi:hypothetical protein